MSWTSIDHAESYNTSSEATTQPCLTFGVIHIYIYIARLIFIQHPAISVYNSAEATHPNSIPLWRWPYFILRYYCEQKKGYPSSYLVHIQLHAYKFSSVICLNCIMIVKFIEQSLTAEEGTIEISRKSTACNDYMTNQNLSVYTWSCPSFPLLPHSPLHLL